MKTVPPKRSEVTRKKAVSTSKGKIVDGVPVYLKDVQSKIVQEHRQRRNQILRVRKNQTQKMKEAITKQRLREYDARQLDEQENRYPRPQNPLEAERGRPGEYLGASALEIADSFAHGDLLEKFRVHDDEDETETRNM